MMDEEWENSESLRTQKRKNKQNKIRNKLVKIKQDEIKYSGESNVEKYIRLKNPEVYPFYQKTKNVPTAYGMYYETLNGKTISLSKIYDYDIKELSKYAVIKHTEKSLKLGITRNYFISNKFQLEYVADSNYYSYYHLHFLDNTHNFKFYIDYTFGSGGDCECCAGYTIEIF